MGSLAEILYPRLERDSQFFTFIQTKILDPSLQTGNLEVGQGSNLQFSTLVPSRQKSWIRTCREIDILTFISTKILNPSLQTGNNLEV